MTQSTDHPCPQTPSLNPRSGSGSQNPKVPLGTKQKRKLTKLTKPTKATKPTKL